MCSIYRPSSFYLVPFQSNLVSLYFTPPLSIYPQRIENACFISRSSVVVNRQKVFEGENYQDFGRSAEVFTGHEYDLGGGGGGGGRGPKPTLARSEFNNDNGSCNFNIIPVYRVFANEGKGFNF